MNPAQRVLIWKNNVANNAGKFLNEAPDTNIRQMDCFYILVLCVHIQSQHTIYY